MESQTDYRKELKILLYKKIMLYANFEFIYKNMYSKFT